MSNQNELSQIDLLKIRIQSLKDMQYIHAGKAGTGLRSRLDDLIQKLEKDLQTLLGKSQKKK